MVSELNSRSEKGIRHNYLHITQNFVRFLQIHNAEYHLKSILLYFESFLPMNKHDKLVKQYFFVANEVFKELLNFPGKILENSRKLWQN